MNPTSTSIDDQMRDPVTGEDRGDEDDETEVRANLTEEQTLEPLNEREGENVQEEEDPKEIMSNIPSLVVAFCASLTTGGTTYSFGLYGATLQKTLHLQESQVDTISTAFFFAGLFSFLPGMCSDLFGTRIALVSGGCCGCVNLLLYWAVAREYIVVPHAFIVPLLSVLGIATYLSSALVTGAVFKTVTVACQGGSNKGTAVGIAKGYVGLGSGLYVAIFEAWRSYNESNLDFLPMAASFCILAVVVPGLLFLPTKERVSRSTFRDDSTAVHYRILYGSFGIMASLIVGSSIAQLFTETREFEFEEALQDEPVRPPKNHVGMAIFLIAIWLLPIYSFFILPRKAYEQIPSQLTDASTELDGEDDDRDETVALPLSNSDEEISFLESSDHVEPLNTSQENSDAEATRDDIFQDEANLIENSDDDDDVVEDKSLLQMLRAPSALLMLWTTTILVGAGTLESNNMDKMVEALGFRKEVTPASLALFSVAQAAARVFTGALSENAAHWRRVHLCMGGDVGGIPRPFFLVLAAVVGLWAHIILGAARTQNVFVVGAALSGAAFGMVWPLMVLIIGEVFGAKNIGANYMFFDGFTSAAGTFVLSKIVAQDVYQAHILPPNHHDDNDDSDDHNSSNDDENDAMCYGTACYRTTHLIVAGLTVSCIATSIAMQIMTRSIYRRKLRSHNQD